MTQASRGGPTTPVPPMNHTAAAPPRDPQACYQLGQSLAAQGDIPRAVEAHGAAIALQASFWPAYLERGRIRLQAQDFHAAARDLEAVVRLAPREAPAFLDLGRALHGTGQVERARGCFAQAIAINPGFAEAHYNLGVLDFAAGRIDAAVEHYAKAIAYKPEFLIGYSNLSVALEARDETDEALEVLEKAIAIAPHDPAAQWNKALLLLRAGRHAEGWRQYEWRWGAGKAGDYRRFPGRPLWLGGTKLTGKTILLHAEQGLGDTIQFLRYVPLVAAAGARVVLEMPEPLVGLARRMDGAAEVVAEGAGLPPFDVHCPLMSLPLAFGTTLDSLPMAIPYITPDEERLTRWRAALGPQARPRVGLVWRGNPRHEADALRSMPFARLRELLVGEADYICLQIPVPAEDLEAMQSLDGTHLSRPALEDFDDTAALVALCDVVVSVDTAVAHLAGAMGKPVWLMLPRRAEWRWLKDRTDSPWYPTARLFRQQEQGDWSTILSTIRSKLTRLAGE